MGNFPIELLLLIGLLFIAFTQVGCLEFNYSSFGDEERLDLIKNNSYIVFGAIQVTPDVTSSELITDEAGRALYKDKFRLWSKSKGKVKRASFNTTFVLNVSNRTITGGEGIAFILTGDTALPEKSYGKWLGIVDENTNGSRQAQIVAVEFDTRKSYPTDIDSNHVGLDVNSINSIKQVSLSSFGIQLLAGIDVTVVIQYDGNNITIFASRGNDSQEAMRNRIFSEPFDLSSYLPQNVYVGFSASTGNDTQLNCVKSWEFYGSDIGNSAMFPIWIVIVIVVVVVVLLGGVVIYVYLKWTSRQKQTYGGYPSIEDIINGSSLVPRKFRLKELQKATGNFNTRNMLGRGGFGTVYKGFLENMWVAIKRVSENSLQGVDEFLAEVTTIGSLHHKNLVRLIGWCHERHDLLLVYEYLPKSSLDKYLYWDEKTGIEEKMLNLITRSSILCGVADALNYLHNGCEKRILHRDIKSSNIMLDFEFNAKLGDFGLARTIQPKETHHSTNIAGTPAYMAPECFLSGRATVETDIYAFGVLILEVISGRRPGIPNEQNEQSSIVYWIWDLYKQGRIRDAVDSRLEGDLETEEIEDVLLLGLACCHPNPNERPSMKNVLQVLTGETESPQIPKERPAFVWPAMPPSFKSEQELSFPGGQVTILTELTGR